MNRRSLILGMFAAPALLFGRSAPAKPVIEVTIGQRMRAFAAAPGEILNIMANYKYHHLYNTAQWKHRREHQLAQHPLCCTCERAGRVSAANVADHIHPHRGDRDKFFNGELQSLCEPCHSSVKQAEERTGMVRGARVDGMPADPKHPWNV